MSGTYFRKGDNKSCCPVCGKEYRASEYRKRWDGLWVCPKDYEERHPQDFLRVKADDMRPAVVAGCCGSDGLPQIATSDAPLCPFPLEPLDDTILNSATTASLSWSTFPGVASYQIYLWEDGDPQPTSATYTTTTSPYFVTGLTQDTGYWWYVTAVGEDGEIRDCSGNARFFTTALPLLACPELVSPSDEFSFEGDSITLDWNAVSGASSYNVYVFPQNGPRQLVTNTASTSYEVTGLDQGVTYFWTVTAVNASGESAACGLKTFSTENTVLLSAASYTAYDSETYATIVVLRNGNIGEVSADYATADDTATAPGDYTETTGTVSWPDGDIESRPVQIPIEPLEEVTERATDYLPDWGEDSDDPRVDGRPYDYRYGETTYTTEEEAVTAAETALGYSLAKLPIWRRRRNGEAPGEPSPLESIDPGEDEFLNFQYVDAVSASYLNTSLMWSEADFLAEGGYASPEPFTGIAGLGVPLNTYFYLNIYSGIIGYLYSSGDAFSQPPPTTTVRGWGAGNNCIEPTCPLSPTGVGGNPGIAQLLGRGMTDIGVRRLTAPPPLPGSEFPDWPVDPEHFWQDPDTLQIYSKEPWAQVSGSYRWLSLYSATGGGLSTVERRPLGPVLPIGHPDDNETFWTAAYDAAVLAGDLPSGMTYDSTGTAPSLSRFPRNTTYAYERSYKLPLSFEVNLSNPVGAELIDPDSATVYILPA